jgi:hypothetical protein
MLLFVGVVVPYIALLARDAIKMRTSVRRIFTVHRTACDIIIIIALVVATANNYYVHLCIVNLHKTY